MAGQGKRGKPHVSEAAHPDESPLSLKPELQLPPAREVIPKEGGVHILPPLPLADKLPCKAVDETLQLGLGSHPGRPPVQLGIVGVHHPREPEQVNGDALGIGGLPVGVGGRRRRGGGFL